MNILFISKDAAWQKYRNDILNRYSEKYQKDITIITCENVDKDFITTKNLRYIVCNDVLSFTRRISFLPFAIYYILTKRPDVVFGLNNTSHITEYVSLLICRILNIHFVWWTHAYDHVKKPKSINRSLRKAYMLYFLKKSNAVMTFSELGRTHLTSNGLDSNRVFHCPNTLGSNAITYSELVNIRESNTIFNELSLLRSFKYLIYCGRLTKQKEVGQIIEFVATLQKKIPNISLIVIGDGESKLSLIEQVENKEYNFIHFVGSIYDEKLLSRYFSIAEFFIMPRYAGLSLVHAMLNGLPVLTLNDSSHGPEFQYVSDGFNALVADSYPELEKMVLVTINDKNKMKKLQQGAFHTSKNDAGVDSMLTEMNRAFTCGN